MLEWAEFSFFAYMADYLCSLFFPVDNASLARFKIYGIFAASYLMRPLGAIFFGHLGDKFGRTKPFTISLILMAISTLSIGLLPVYNTIGSTASILLLIFRMLQGLAVGGEFNGATVILTEHDKKRPYLAGSWTAFASAAGMSLGSFMATVISALDNIPNLWRLPFIISSILAIIAIWIRKSLVEPEEFIQARKFKTPLIAALKYDKKAIFVTLSISAFVSIYVYTGNIYYKTIASGFISAEKAHLAITIGVLLCTLLIPFMGHLADKANGYNMLRGSLASAFILSPVFMWLAQSSSELLVILGQVIYGVIDAIFSATAFTILTSQFQTGTKYSGTSFAWSVPTAVFGGTTLMINEVLFNRLNWTNGPGIYISLAAGICLLCITKYVCNAKNS